MIQCGIDLMHSGEKIPWTAWMGSKEAKSGVSRYRKSREVKKSIISGVLDACMRWMIETNHEVCVSKL